MSTTQQVVIAQGTDLGHFSDTPLLVLACLESGPKHGHSMLRLIETTYRTRLGPGGLYGAISRLEAKGLIAPLPLDDRRRPYQITESGLRLLYAQLETMRRLTSPGEELPAIDQPLPRPSFYEVESDSDVVDEIDQFAAAKPQPEDPDQLPFRHLGGRRFEILAYLLLQRQHEGSVVTLVKATRDGGRDALVHTDGLLSAVIQCKNLGNRFSQRDLLEELIKLVLYDVIEHFIPESGIAYEVWAPAGLTAPADEWVRNWPHSLGSEELKTAFEKVIRDNKTLAHLKWEDIGGQISETLKKRIRLYRHEAVSLTSRVRSAPDLYAQFFEITVVARLEQVEGILTSQLKPVNDQLANLTDVVMGDEIDELINQARDLVNERRFREAAATLKQVESKKRHKPTDRQRFRIASNYGAIAYGENKPNEAAQRFLEAVRLAPEDELARVNEVFAHYLLGNRKRAFDLATERRRLYPFNGRLAGIRINSAPENFTPAELAEGLDSALLGDAEVCVALARRCMMADLLDKAEGYASDAVLVTPKWSQPWMLRAQVRIGMLMEQNAGFRLFNGDRKGILQEAIADANEAVSASAEEGSWATAEALAVRAQLHFLNEDVARGTEDAKAAYKLDQDILSVALLMSQCHLMNGQTDSAIEVLAASYKQEARPDIVLLYAKTLASRAKQDDLAKAAQVAASVDLGTVPARMRDGFVMNVVQFMVLLKDWSATQEYVQKTKPQLHPVTALALEAHTCLGRGDRDSANRLADEALAIVSGDVQASTKEMFAGLLMQLGRAEDALPIFQELFDKDIPTFDPRQLIACAAQLNLDDKVLEICEQLRARRSPDWKMLEYEVQYLEKYNRDKAIRLLQEFLEGNPGHKLAQLRLSVLGVVHGRPDLVRSSLSDLPPVEDLPIEYVMPAFGLLREGADSAEAMDYAYRYLRGHFDRQQAHEGYIQVVVTRADREEPPSEEEIVGSDSAVLCQEVGSGELRWFVLENTDKPVRDFEEIALTDQRAINLLGKRVGDTFVLAPATMGDRIAVIKKIQSKYVRRFQDCMTELQVRFGPSAMVQSVFVGTPDAIMQPGMVTIMTDLQRRAVKLAKVQEFYANNPSSLHMYGASMGKNAYLALEHVAQTTGLDVKCFEGTAGLPDASLLFLRERPLILVDLTAVATMRLLGLDWIFTAKAYRFAVTQTTWEELNDTLLDDKKGTGRRANVRFEGGQYVWEEYDETAMEQLRLENAAFLQSFKEHVSILPAQELAAVPPKEREQIIECFGTYGAETMAVSGNSGMILWTDDFPLGSLAASTFGARRTWTQMVLLSLVEAGLLSRDDYNKAVAKLIGCGFTITFFDPQCMLEACRLADFGAARFPLRQLVEVFRKVEMPNGMLIRLFLEFFTALQQEPPLFQKKALIIRAFLEALWANPATHDLVMALRPMSSKLFGLNVIAAAEFNAAFDEWLRSLNRPIL